MQDEFTTLADEFRYEIDPIKGSRFLASVAPAATTEQALDYIGRLRTEFAKATHNCWAFRLGREGSEFRSSDDGEPSGSAGRPILQQIEGHAITDAVIVVTRWFGGTKLGVGGLMRAYGGAAGQALDRAPTRTVIPTQALRLEYPYECTGAMEALLSAHKLTPKDAEYGATVGIVVEVVERDVEAFQRDATDATAGRVRIRNWPPLDD